MKKEEKRGLSIILFLLRNKPTKQQELKSKLNSNVILKGEISDATLSNSLKSLQNKGIIVKTPTISEGKGANPNLIQLKQDHNTLIQILKEFYPQITASLYFTRIFMPSPYVQKFINENLLKTIETNIQETIENKIPGMNFKFTDEENVHILNILKSSPSALYYATESHKTELEEKLENEGKQFENYNDLRLEEEIDNLKRRFILNLQLKLGLDINRNVGNYKNAIEFSVTVKFFPIKNNERYNKKFINKIRCSEIQSVITTHSKSTIRKEL